MFHRRSFALIILTTFALARGSTADVFHSDSYGYSLSVPADWKPIPPDVIRETIASVQNQDDKNKAIYDAAFEPKPLSSWFDYPYVMVQVIPYAKFGMSRQINEEELEQAVKSMTGAALGNMMDTALAPDARTKISDANLDRPQFDQAPRRYLMPLTRRSTSGEPRPARRQTYWTTRRSGRR